MSTNTTDLLKTLETVSRRCDLMLEFLNAKAAEESKINLSEYIRSIQYVLLVIEEYQRTDKDERPIIETNITDASLNLYLYLEHICLPEFKRTFSRVLLSHRLCTPLDNLHIELYKEAALIQHTLRNNIRRSRDSSQGGGCLNIFFRKKKEEEVPPPDKRKYSFLPEHTTFSHFIRDEEGRQFWQDSFEGRLMVKWDVFLTALSNVCNPIDEKDAVPLAYVMDPSRTGFVSVFRFSNFIQIFKPLRQCVERLKSFQGYMSHDEVTRLLNGMPSGTYVTRLSKSKPGEIIISHVDENGNVHNILVEAYEGGFRTTNTSLVKTGSTLTELMESYKSLAVGFTNELPAREYFFGSIHDEEASHLLRKEIEGTFLVRFDGTYIAVSFLNQNREVMHYRGVHYEMGEYFFSGHTSTRYARIDEVLSTLSDVKHPLSFSTFDPLQPKFEYQSSDRDWTQRRLATPSVNQRADFAVGTQRTVKPPQSPIYHSPSLAPACDLLLLNASVHTLIVDRSARVIITVQLKNNSGHPQDTSYTFPLSKSAVVSSFRAESGGRIIRSVVHEKGKAIQGCEEVSGNIPCLLEQDSDVSFKCLLGPLDPNKNITLTLIYVTALTVSEDAISFDLPTFEKIPKISFSADIHTVSPPVDVEANCPLTLQDRRATASITWRDTFFMRIIVADIFKSPGRVEKNGKGGRVASFTFHPDLRRTEEEEQGQINTEIIFLLDCSDSMNGTPMQKVNQTMELLLRALPRSCYFNVFNFGSTHRSLWPASVKYNDENFAQAMEANKKRKADLGGTELYKPLESIFNQPPLEGLSRQVFLLTDGGVNNSDAVVSLALKDSHLTRIFTFGIGNSVDEKLVSQLAKVTNGECELIPAINMEAAIMRQVNRALRPGLTNVSITRSIDNLTLEQLMIDWGHIRNLASVRQTPYHLPPLFSGDEMTVYLRLSDQELLPLQDHRVTATLRGKAGDKDWSQQVTVNMDQVTETKEDEFILTRLYGRSLIDSLLVGRSHLHRTNGFLIDRSTNVIRESTDVSLETGVVSRQTAFVAVEENNGRMTAQIQQSNDLTSFIQQAPLYQVQASSSPSGTNSLYDALPSFNSPPTSPKKATMTASQESEAVYGVLPSVSLPSPIRSATSSPAMASESLYTNINSTQFGLSRILNNQAPTGHFEKTVLSVLRLDVDQMNKSLPGDGDTMDIFITAVVVTYLDEKMRADKDTWSLSVRKARDWMKKAAREKGTDIQRFHSAAHEFVKNTFG
ncbi:hypothetical protein PROFUN_15561 [Planoprotostelium fungivorum]|uniref:Uncharacterized protein n=1 Tax=Planoprotostelium fungivorum TaxID=1890364 RepID=A0A2P6MVG6_9EUKA|nr:hypothetical protein PROFUN_15561 [Planoprotostelium fungivorum]